MIGWITIDGGTIPAFGGISFIVCSNSGKEIVAVAILDFGFIVGATWATWISMKHETME